MPLYLFGEDARRFLRAQGSNLRISDDFCVEIDECGEWYVRITENILRKIAEVSRMDDACEMCIVYISSNQSHEDV